MLVSSSALHVDLVETAELLHPLTCVDFARIDVALGVACYVVHDMELARPASRSPDPADDGVGRTVDDPKFYARSWTWMRANFYWVLGQEFEETFCIPSEGIAYRDSLARPSGIDAQ